MVTVGFVTVGFVDSDFLVFLGVFFVSFGVLVGWLLGFGFTLLLSSYVFKSV